jgi:hypothetical protein
VSAPSQFESLAVRRTKVSEVSLSSSSGTWSIAVLSSRATPSASGGATWPLSSDSRVARTDTSPTGRFAVVWQRSSYPYTIKAAFGP